MEKRRSKRIKAVSEMSIIEVLRSPLFFEYAEKQLIDIWGQRVLARRELKPLERLISHPIDELHEMGLLKTGNFILTYARVLKKKEKKLSAAKRNFILGFGNGVFNQTIKKLLEDEKERNNSNGDDKQ